MSCARASGSIGALAEVLATFSVDFYFGRVDASCVRTVSTALWTGVYLADILEYVRPVRPQAKHVIFEGADDLPKGPYGTSQKLSWAMDPEKGMMIGTQR